MLTVDQYEYIRTAHRVYGKEIWQIKRETGHSRKTIRKALKGEHKGYRSRRSQPYPSLGPYLKVIDKWLEADKTKPKKQRHTAIRVYNRLKLEHRYKGGQSTVRRYVRAAKRRIGVSAPSAFIPLEPVNNGEAEVDWGHCRAILSGKSAPLYLFCMRSKYSGRHFVRCYPFERQQAVFDGLIEAFGFFGGVFPILIFDNMKTAVAKILRGHGRLLQDNFLKFQAFFNFDSRFCNPGQGHEKGGVEGLVGYSRRNYMVPIPEFDSLESLNENLLGQCAAYGGHRISGREETVQALHKEEKRHLIPMPAEPFSNIIVTSGKVDKYQTVIADKNRYSTPTCYVGLRVAVIVHLDKIDIHHENKRIASHKRLYSNNKWSLDPFHYLDLISRRPRSFESARPIRQWRKQWPPGLESLLERFCREQGQSGGTRDFISILWLFKDHDEAKVMSAVKKALDANISSAAAIKHILTGQRANQNPAIKPLTGWERFSPPDLSLYDQIGGAS